MSDTNTPPQLDDVIVDDVLSAPDDLPLGDGISEARASGLVAVLDTRELRYVSGPVERDQVPDDVKVTRSGRYQLRRV